MDSAPALLRVAITIQGNVQGVGFRPFIHRLANRHGLVGSVANTTTGVEIIAQGSRGAIDCFCRAIPEEKPLPAVIAHLTLTPLLSTDSAKTLTSFQIIASANNGRHQIAPPHDMDLCTQCCAELLDPANRRFRHPFISCTDCGPRYTVIHNLPFDRAETTMKGFPLCPLCAEEYNDPDDRRFHAQSICCPDCGPRYFVADRDGEKKDDADPIRTAIDFLDKGKIVAIKGVGGYHLAVDAGNRTAVQLLRERKHRPDKPLALMAADLQTVRQFARLNDTEATALSGRGKPIVLLEKRDDFPLPDNLAPANRRIGVMLPYTPLHHLLLAEKKLLVMTSGNRSGEPICTGNDDAVSCLAGIADLFLQHDREIIIGCDDPVQVCRGDQIVTFRNGRGIAPTAISLQTDGGQIMALGGNDKNSICLTRGNEAFLSQHIGNLDHYETMQRFRQVGDHLCSLLQITPDLLIHDLHPDYPSSRHAAEQSKLPTITIQHHHAHAVSCMAEHNLTSPVLALTLDGSGYGLDHTVWGGEILCARLDGFDRLGYLSPVMMPGGEQAIREPWRMAVALAHHACGDNFAARLPEGIRQGCAKELPTIITMIEKGINSPRTSSCGRLFDAVAALLGLCLHASFDGQGAMALEAIADTTEQPPYSIKMQADANGALVLDSGIVIREILTDLENGISQQAIASRFHATVAALFAAACTQIRSQTTLSTVVCSGGVFQNQLLTALLTKQLERDGFTVYTHQQTPANDGGLALGQAVAGQAIHQRRQ